MITELLPHDVQSAILQAAIVRTLPMIAPDTTMLEAIALMAETGSSYVLVAEHEASHPGQSNLMGLLTEPDIVQITAQSTALGQLSLRSMIGHPVITLHESAMTDIRHTLLLFQRYQIRYLIILDDHDRPVGLLAQSNLTQGLAQHILQLEASASPIEESQTEAGLEALNLTEQQSGSQNTQQYVDPKYQDLFDFAPDGYLVTNPSGVIQMANCTIANQLAVSQSDLIDQAFVRFMHEQDYSLFYTRLHRLVLRGQKQIWEVILYSQQGNPFPAEITVVPIYDDSNAVTCLRWLVRDISERKRDEAERDQAELLLEIQRAILEQIAKGEPLPKVLDMLIRSMEEQLDGAPCSILLCNEGRLHHGAAPHLPLAYTQAINGVAIGEGIGSCGTAAFRGQSVIVSDIANDVLWQDFKELALAHNLRACWSVPIMTSEHRVLGTFAVYHHETYTPTEKNLFIVAVAANIAGIAIERDQANRDLEKLTQELEQRVVERTAALHESEERWQLALRGTNDGIWDWDLRNSKVFFSSRWKRMRGFQDHEIGDSPDECLSRIHSDDYDRVMAAVDEHFAGRTEFFEIEYRVKRKDGSYMWVLDRAQALRDGSGQIIRMSGSDTDITDRKQAENALYESQQFLQTVLDSFPLAVFWKDRNSVYLGANRNFLTAAGLTSVSDIIGKTDYDMPWGQAEAEAYRIDDQQVMNTGEAKLGIIETQIQANGNQLWLETNKIPLHNLMGEVIGVLGTYQNITARRQAELDLQASELRFRRMFDSNVVGMIFADFQGQITNANDRFLQMIGYTRAELEAGEIRWDRMTPPEHVSADVVAIDCLTRNGRMEPWEKEYYCKDGSRLPVIVGAAVLPGSEEQTICVVVDISDRKQMECQLTESEAKFRRLVEGMNDLIWSCSKDGKFTYLSPQFQTFFEFKPSDWIGKSFLDLIHPDDVPTMIEHQNAVLAGQMVGHAEFRHRHHNNYYLWVSINATPIMNSEGEVIAMQGALTNIDDRKQAELALQESQRFIQQIAEASPNLLYLYDLQEQRNIYVNREIRFLLGYSPEEIQQMGSAFPQTLMHSDDLRVILPAFQHQLAAAQDGEIVENEFRLRDVNGEWHWLCSRDSVFSRDAEGQVKLVVGTAQDITDRKRLQQEQSRLITLLEASTDYIMIADLVGTAIWNNTALKRLRGLSSDIEVKRQGPSNYHPEWAVEMMEQMAVPTALAQGSWLGENVLLDAEGQEIPVSQLILAHRSPQGEIEFFSTIMRDMRVHKEYEQRLEKTNAELLRATRLKDEFLANMSHELRTPLNAILGMTEGLQEQVFGAMNDRQLKALQTIDRSGSHLLELINDILDVAKIEAGQIDLNYTSTSIHSLCQSSLVFIRQQSYQKNIQLEVKLPNQLPALVVDERRIRQVLINLLNNAMKFTPAGGKITLEVNSQDRKAGTKVDSWICFSITDTGIGIAPEHIHKLFQPFVQIDSALNRQYTGTGLGLALVKRIVELHGGNVKITSKLGEGSCFTIELPCTPDRSWETEALGEESLITPTLKDAPAEEEAQEAPLILLAEDNEANISTVSGYLEAKGYRILLAKHGEAAIELARTQQPDLILMDIQMPGMDGLEAIRQIRTHAQLDAVPIIALTALAMTGDREKCLEGGANDYLTKPVRLKQLVTTIQQHLAATKVDTQIP